MSAVHQAWREENARCEADVEAAEWQRVSAELAAEARKAFDGGRAKPAASLQRESATFARWARISQGVE